jgi:anaerobic magnesium-protoporphyrin IX monomethyl ester cyclase
MNVLFINPYSTTKNYQALADKYAAIETPTWALLLAESCRSKGFKVGILDANAERLNSEETFKKIVSIKPSFICLVVYGQNVNAGTTNMAGAMELANYIKSNQPDFKIGLIGSHIQALPKETMEKEKSIDIGFINEGVYALHNLLKLKNLSSQNLANINGIIFRDQKKIIFTEAEIVVPQNKMDEDLPGYAWDLLPFKNKPLDLYRAPLWHAEYQEEFRSPYAAIQTSIGCQFKCSFCMINIINKNDNEEIGIASNYSGMRFWSPNFIIKEFDKLFSLGVRTIKITDEMFLLNQKFYLPLCEMLAERNRDDKNKMWAYSRIDTVKNPEILSKVRKAGIKWLCLGIESGRKDIRLEVSKGKFEDVDVEKIVSQVEKSDINVMANYIYGLPGDTKESIQYTFELSKKLNTLGWNTYAAMALPGSQLYKEAVQNGTDLPKTYSEFSFHSYDTKPLPTKKLKATEILKIRDDHFHEYFSNINFQSKIKTKFGQTSVDNINDMLKVKLKRRIIEEEFKI